MKEVFKTIYGTTESMIHGELDQLNCELTALNLGPENLPHEKYVQIRDLCDSILFKYRSLNRHQKAAIDIRIPSRCGNTEAFITNTKRNLKELAYEFKLQRLEALTQKLAIIEQSRLKADSEGNSKPSGRKPTPANK